MSRMTKRRNRQAWRRGRTFSAQPSLLSLAIRGALRRHAGLTSALTLGVMLSTGVSDKALAQEAQALSLNTSAEQTAVLDTGLLVIDPSVPGYRGLLSGLRPGIRAVVLDAERDGLSQLGELLKAHRGVRAVHLLAHGEPGGLRLGNAWVRREDLDAHPAELSRWFAPGPFSPELIVYGCNVAAGTEGEDFVERLSALTGADVAASDDVTGTQAQGGDWVLEHTSGPIESPLAFSSETLTAYPELLAIFTVDSTADTADISPGDGACADGSSPNPKCTLRAAVMEANALAGADTITVPAGTYTLAISGINEDAAATGDLDVTTDITITGAGQNQTTIDANGLDRVLHVLPRANLTLERTKVTGGAARDGGGIFNFGTAMLSNSTVSGNSSSGSGGGVFNSGNATLTLTASAVSGNSAYSSGGGIYNQGLATLRNGTTISSNSAGNNGGGITNRDRGKVTLRNSSRVSGNSATFGGGISNAISSTTTLESSTISGNSATFGGGIANIGTATLSNSTVSGNSADISGGGIRNDDTATLTLTASLVSSNSARDGGGIHNNQGATAALTASTVSGNSASSRGGGIFNYGTATLTNSTASGNSASSRGGGIYNRSTGTATLNNSAVSGNSAYSGGGGIYNAGTLMLSNGSAVSDNIAIGAAGISNQGTAALNQSTISGNSASYNAGGIFNSGAAMFIASTVSGNVAANGSGGIQNNGTATLENSTVSGNSAASLGGGIFNFGSATINDSTIFGNRAALGGGGGIRNQAPATLTLARSVIANSFGGNCASAGIFTDGGFNLADDPSCGFTPTANINLDPVLADNGGPTQTHALLFGSSAIDAVTGCVNSPPTDQRGVSRPQGLHCDTGAFEAEDSDGDGIADVNDALPFVNQGAVVITIINSILLDD